MNKHKYLFFAIGLFFDSNFFPIETLRKDTELNEITISLIEIEANSTNI